MAADEAREKATRKTNDVGPTGRTVAANVARLRTLRGLSTYKLSERLAELDRPIAPSAITRIESATRKVDIDDIFALAVALRVAPTALLLPPTADDSETVDITAAGEHPAGLAWSWLIGLAPLQIPEGDDGEAWMDFQTHSRPRGMRNYWKGVHGDVPFEEARRLVAEARERDEQLPQPPAHPEP